VENLGGLLPSVEESKAVRKKNLKRGKLKRLLFMVMAGAFVFYDAYRCRKPQVE
jgi:hypothetical protein